MTEILAVLTVAFAGYVLYEVFKTVSQPSSDSQSHFRAASPSDLPAPASAPASAKPAKAERPPAAAPSAAPAAAAEEKTITLRNPNGGETCPVPTNYRFAKKWVKEALVAEGLLKKVYKNSELTEAVAPKVKEALEKLKTLEKYHA